MIREEVSTQLAVTSRDKKTRIRDRISLLRIYSAPLYVALLWTDWAVESGGLMSSSSSLKSGWDLTQGSTLVVLGLIVVVAIMQYLMRLPVSRRSIIRIAAGLGSAFITFVHFLAAAVLLFSTVDPGDFLIGLRLFSSLGDYQLGYYIEISLAWVYLLAAMFEAVVLVVGTGKKAAGTTSATEANSASKLTPGLATSPEQCDEVVLLIHGTGSALPTAEGDSWWQIRSQTWHALNERLPGGVRCHDQRRVFHWSGHNSEQARRSAGKDLHRFLTTLEQQKTKYHVVAHSHGGSVLWHALQRAVGRGQPLDHLQSWTTLGTPFMRYQAYRNAWALALPLIVTLLIVSLNTSWLAAAASAWDLLVEGGYFPTILLLVAIASATSLLVVYNAYRVANVSYALFGCWHQGRLDQRVFNLYGARWLPLWSRSDEAICGLQGTLRVVRGAPSEPRRDTANPFSRLAHIISLPMRIGYARVVRPIIDEFVWDRLMRKIQGNDLGDHRLRVVAASPLATDASPPLDEAIEGEVVDMANSHCEQSGGLLRASLGLAASSEYHMSQVGEHLASLLNGKELVHWSYYQVGSVLDTIAKHIRANTQNAEASIAQVGDHAEKGNAEHRHVDASPVPHHSPLIANDHSGMRALVIAQLALVGGIALVGHSLHTFVLDQFTQERQIKEVIWRLPEEPGEDTESLMQWAHEYVRAGLAEFDTTVDEKYSRMANLDSHVQLALVWALVNQQKSETAVKLTNQVDDPFYRTSAAILLGTVIPAEMDKVTFRDTDSGSSSDYGEDRNQVREVSVAIANAGTQGAFARSAISSDCEGERTSGLGALLRLMGGRSLRGRERSEAALLHARAWTGDEQAIVSVIEAREQRVGPVAKENSILELLIGMHPFNDWSERSERIARSVLAGGTDAEVGAVIETYVRYGGWNAILELTLDDGLDIDDARRGLLAVTLFDVLERHGILQPNTTAVSDLTAEDQARFEEFKAVSRRLSLVVDRAIAFRNVAMAIEVTEEEKDDSIYDYAWFSEDDVHLRIAATLVERRELSLAREMATDMMVQSVGPRYDEWTPTRRARDVGRLLATTGQFFYARKMYPHLSSQSHRLEVDAAILATYTNQLTERTSAAAATYVALYQEKDQELGLNRSSAVSAKTW